APKRRLQRRHRIRLEPETLRSARDEPDGDRYFSPNPFEGLKEVDGRAGARQHSRVEARNLELVEALLIQAPEMDDAGEGRAVATCESHGLRQILGLENVDLDVRGRDLSVRTCRGNEDGTDSRFASSLSEGRTHAALVSQNEPCGASGR